MFNLESLRGRMREWFSTSDNLAIKIIRTEMESRKAGRRLKMMFEGLDIVIDRLRDESSHCRQWLTADNFKRLSITYNNFTYTDKTVVCDAMDNMIYLLGAEHDIDKFVVFFKTYVTDALTFEAIMLGFFVIPFELSERGCRDTKTGDLTDPEMDRELIRVIAANCVTERLVRASPGRWEYNELLKELLAQFSSDIILK